MAGYEHRYNNTFPRDQQRPVYSILLLWITHDYQPWCLVCGSTVCDSHATRACCCRVGAGHASPLSARDQEDQLGYDTRWRRYTNSQRSRHHLSILKLCPTGGSMVYDRPDRRLQIAPKGEITVVVLAAQRPCLGRLSSPRPSLNSSVPLSVFLCSSFTSCCRIQATAPQLVPTSFFFSQCQHHATPHAPSASFFLFFFSFLFLVPSLPSPPSSLSHCIAIAVTRLIDSQPHRFSISPYPSCRQHLTSPHHHLTP